MKATDISKNVSFTGHRSGRISQPMLTLFAGMVTEIKRLYASGCRNFFSGMAEGGDLIFAKAVLAVRNELTDIRLVAAIPFREQSARYSDPNKRPIPTRTRGFTSACWKKRTRRLSFQKAITRAVSTDATTFWWNMRQSCSPIGTGNPTAAHATR